MELHIGWTTVAVRLALTLAAGGLLGMERSRSGHTAGLRTTLLVMLAASLSMIQMNLLIPTNGKPQDSYAVMDLMRLPLGILTGVGFIGAGAILRKNELVIGLTTAATLWYATVVGLCLGGGQLSLGVAATVIGFVVLWGLRRIESRAEHLQMAELRITLSHQKLTTQDLRSRLESARFRIKSLSFTDCMTDDRRKFDCEVLWPAEHGNDMVPDILTDLENLPGVVEFEWKGVGTGPS
jgi:putative Mg2+ transporter-C (MgtC) family protein